MTQLLNKVTPMFEDLQVYKDLYTGQTEATEATVKNLALMVSILFEFIKKNLSPAEISEIEYLVKTQMFHN